MYSDSYDLAYRKAKQFEGESKWHEAASVWQSIGRSDDANACITIAYATERGDAYREEVDNVLGPEPELTPTTIKEYLNWHKNLAEIYRKHFG